MERIVLILNLPRESDALVHIVGFCLIIIFLSKSAIALFINYIIIEFSQGQQLRLRSYLMKSYQSFPFTEYTQRNSSEYIHTIHQLSGQFCVTIMVLLRTISEGLVSIVIISILIFTNAEALFILLGILSIAILCYDFMFRKKLRYSGEMINNYSIEMLKNVNEGIYGLKKFVF